MDTYYIANGRDFDAFEQATDVPHDIQTLPIVQKRHVEILCSLIQKCLFANLHLSESSYGYIEESGYFLDARHNEKDCHHSSIRWAIVCQYPEEEKKEEEALYRHETAIRSTSPFLCNFLTDRSEQGNTNWLEAEQPQQTILGSRQHPCGGLVCIACVCHCNCRIVGDSYPTRSISSRIAPTVVFQGCSQHPFFHPTANGTIPRRRKRHSLEQVSQ